MAEESTTQEGGIGLPVGTKIGKYEIKERRAVGGQAIVYRGYDPLLDRQVAIKQISSHLAEDPKFLERFRREAQILARLGAEQTAIVTIHEMIEQEQGLFIVMEFLGGHSLETILEDTHGPVEMKATLQVLFRLAAALYDVHAAGIIHRDIKPANIIIGDGLRPKITDFGVAASTTGQTSMVLGTTKYMAPELFEGGDVDARADIYSLGMITYEMLIGRPRFNEIFADIVRDRHSEALRWMKWHGDTASEAPPVHEVNPAIPEALSEIVARMMAKNRDDRFAGMEDLGREIKLNFSGRARAAGPDGEAAPPRRRKGRPKPAEGTADHDPLEARDGADDLELAADQTPTSRLPKKTVPLKAKLAVVAVVLLGGLGALIWTVVQRNMERERLMKEVRAAFRDAEVLYGRAEYDEAIGKFEKFLRNRRYERTLQHAKASVLVHMAKAQATLRDADKLSDWESTASAAHEAATAQLNRVQEQPYPLKKWVADIDRQLSEFKDALISTRIFSDAMRKAREEVGREQFDPARQSLREGAIASIDLTEAQRQRVMGLLAEIDEKEFWSVYKARLAAAEPLLEEARKTHNVETFDRADAAFGKAQQWLESSNKVNFLKPDERRAMLAALKTKRADLVRDRDYRIALTAADKAPDRRTKIARLQEAHTLIPSAELRQKIDNLRSEDATEKGVEAFNGGDKDAARLQFKIALKFNPKNERARAKLAQLDESRDRAKLLDEADRLVAAGKWAEAQVKYEAAAKIQLDEALAAKIVDCRFQIALAEARAFRKKKEYDEAKAAYREAQRIKPAEQDAVEAEIGLMVQDQIYESRLAQARGLLQRKKWDDAIKAFNEALTIKPKGPEALAGKRDANYGTSLDKGEQRILSKDWTEAKAYLRLAKSYRATKKVEDLLNFVDEQIEKNKKP